MGQTIIEKLWNEHSVADLGDGSHLLYIDRVLFHERTGSIALKGLEAADRQVRNPEQVFGCMDHIVDTIPGRTDETMVPGGTAFITTTRAAARAAGVNLFDLGDNRQGIVHVVSPEQGIALPGVTLVCPDSHTKSKRWSTIQTSLGAVCSTRRPIAVSRHSRRASALTAGWPNATSAVQSPTLRCLQKSAW